MQFPDEKLNAVLGRGLNSGLPYSIPQSQSDITLDECTPAAKIPATPMPVAVDKMCCTVYPKRASTWNAFDKCIVAVVSVTTAKWCGSVFGDICLCVYVYVCLYAIR